MSENPTWFSDKLLWQLPCLFIVVSAVVTGVGGTLSGDYSGWFDGSLGFATIITIAAIPTLAILAWYKQLRLRHGLPPLLTVFLIVGGLSVGGCIFWLLGAEFTRLNSLLGFIGFLLMPFTIYGAYRYRQYMSKLREFKQSKSTDITTGV